MPRVKLQATGAVPKRLKLSKKEATDVTFESDLKGLKVTFDADSPFGEASFAMAGRSAAKALRSSVPEGLYPYSYSWDEGTRDKPTRLADIDITK